MELAQLRIAGLGDALLPVNRTAAPRCWREPSVGGQLAAIAKASEETLEVQN